MKGAPGPLFAGEGKFSGVKIRQNSSSPIEGWIPREGVKNGKILQATLTDFEVSLKGGEYDMTSRRRAQLSKLPLRSDEVQYASLGVHRDGQLPAPDEVR